MRMMKRPKFPNKERAQRKKQSFAVAAGLGVCVLLFLVYALWPEDSPRTDVFAPTSTDSSAMDTAAQALRRQPAGSHSGQDSSSGRQDSSSSGLTDPVSPAFPTAPSAPADSPGAVARPQDNAASTGYSPPSPERPAPPEKPQSAHANAPSLWGLPFVGYSFEEITAELGPKYKKRAPKDWGERLPGITTHLAARPNGPIVALTLDACDGKGADGYDAELIAFLRERKIPATLFITSSWAKNNPQTLKELAADPLFEIAAHGMRHKPCSVNGRAVYGIKGTESMLELIREVEGNVRDLQRATAKRPRWFRSGTAYYDDVAVDVIKDLQLSIAGYSISADEGATLPPGKVTAKTLAAKNGDILLAHMNHPRSGTRQGLMDALPALQEKGFVFVKLSGM